ncbi:progonadoliberin-1-like [Anabas testudineus]|uniref:progonadoliberin-1-like n=1 Tax=Anabas testudineus TaxID=64144 RepID=UPI000E4631C1|nr:progonadoliberin-1-like [Anabas testudineus]
MERRMAVKLLALLLVGTLVPLHCCQHWSYGLSPGGKRDLDSISDTLDNIVEGFPHMDTPCSVVSCAESPLAKLYRIKGFLNSVTDRGNGQRTYKK